MSPQTSSTTLELESSTDAGDGRLGRFLHALVRGDSLKWRLLFVLNICVFFGIWELIARSGAVSSLFLPRPSLMFTAFVDAFSDAGLWGDLAYSSRNFVLGVAISGVVGIPLGLAAGSSRRFYQVIAPYLWAMASLPRIAWLPLLIMILGFTDATKLTLIFMAAVFPIVITCLAGVRTVDSSLLIAGRVFGTGWLARQAHIVLPHTIPYIFAGFRQGMTRALAAVVVSEMFGGSRGVGYVIVLAAKRFNTPLLFAMLLVIVIAALLIIKFVDLLEAKLSPWRGEVIV